MTHAYSELYLSDAKKSLGAMVDYAVHDCEYNVDWIIELFLKSGYAKQFEKGSPMVVGGMSGIELARKIVEKLYKEELDIKAAQPIDKTPEYWAGWALADYQWYSGYRFEDIFEKVKMSEIVDMYHPYHELSIEHFYEAMDQKMDTRIDETKLRKVRDAAGLSQSELAKKSGVSLRSIQMYEQRQNDIDKAQGHTLYKLSVALGCDIEDLLERPNKTI